jgi:hypothetical protein
MSQPEWQAAASFLDKGSEVKMRSIARYLFLMIALTAVGAMTVNAQSFAGGRRPSGNLRTLEDQIFRKLITLPYYGVFDHITYQVNGSTVVLGGSVASLGTRKSAERVVKRILGVERVVNNIRDLPPSSFDNQIRRRLVREIAASPGLYRYLQEPNPSVRLVVDRGRITLEGYVSNRSDANTMNIIANGIPGTFAVRNNLVVTRDRVR